MAKAAASAPAETPRGRQIISASEKPSHLARRSGPGRTRKPTEFDEMVAGWYESGEWFKIPAEGETTDEQLADLEEVFKSVYRAVSFHDLGVTRLKEDDPNDANFSGYGVWVQVRPKQERKRKNKDGDENENDPDQMDLDDNE